MSASTSNYEWAIKIAVGLLVALSGWTLSQESRLTAVEVRSELIGEDVKEIKADVKKLLGGGR